MSAPAVTEEYMILAEQLRAASGSAAVAFIETNYPEPERLKILQQAVAQLAAQSR